MSRTPPLGQFGLLEIHTGLGLGHGWKTEFGENPLFGEITQNSAVIKNRWVIVQAAIRVARLRGVARHARHWGAF